MKLALNKLYPLFEFLFLAKVCFPRYVDIMQKFLDNSTSFKN